MARKYTHYTRSELKRLGTVAPLTVGKIVGAKRPFSVMAAPAAQRSLRRKMHRRKRSGHLFAAARACTNRVAGGTIHIVFS